MGASISVVQHGSGLGDLPEGCIAEVLRRLDPPDICRLVQLSKGFRNAGFSDFIWEDKLPKNYASLVEKALEGVDVNMNNEGLLSKKDVFARLCCRNSFDGGNKEFWLEKNSGGICMQISSKALSITGIDDRRYWNYIPTEETRFETVAYLQQIWWLEVKGEVNFAFPSGTYSIFFRLYLGKPSKRFNRRICISDSIHGWDLKPVRFQLTTSDGQSVKSEIYLDRPGAWVYHHVGDFEVRDNKEVICVKFSLVQIDCTHTKGGLCVDSVLIQPKGLIR